MALTPSQQAAVLYDKNLILFAGPGSGKTATSVAKARHILQRPDTILCMVTFTTAAARETEARMKRAAQASGSPLPQHRLITGTFHALALRHYQKHVRNPKKLIAPPARSALVSSMLNALSPDERSAYMLSLERFQSAMDRESVDIPGEHRQFIEDYLAKLSASHSTDLASVMRDCTLKMQSNEIPRLGVTHMLGDEMQDADEVQLEFMLLHCKAGITTTLVADDDQTIYGWRCALGYAGLQRFAAETQAKTITLAENFRSQSAIVSHAQRLIAFNDPNRIPKNQVAVRGEGGVLGSRSCASLESECEHVAEAIGEHRRDGETIAVLARTNRALDPMEEALSAAGIPYLRESDSLWAQPEVATFLAYLGALVSSATSDLLPVLMLLPLDGTLRRELEAELGARSTAFLDGSVPALTRATAEDVKSLTQFADHARRWRRDLRAGAVNMVIPGVEMHLRGLFAAHHGSSADKRMRRIGILLASASRVLSSMNGLLSKRLGQINQLKRAAAADPQVVRLLTMHGSKGLEFDTVFLLDAGKPGDGATLMDEEPERRLFYVAVTRARDRFVATHQGAPIKYLTEAGIPPVERLADCFPAVAAQTAT